MPKQYVTFARRIADVPDGSTVLFIKDLTEGPRKYDTRRVRAEVSSSPEELPGWDRLWVRSETGYLDEHPRAMRIMEELPPYVPGQPWSDVFVALARAE